MATEFGKLPERRRIPFPPNVPFPEEGLSERAVLDGVREILAADPWEPEADFGLAYAGPPHPIAARAAALAAGSVFVEWVEDVYPGAFRLEKEAVSMVAALLGAPDGQGFITGGGTESNISAVRIARDLAGPRRGTPEFVIPASGHFSFQVAGELLGVRIREIPIDAAMRPDLAALPGLVNRNTVGIAASAPSSAWGTMDPIAEIAAFAEQRGLFFHVDAALGGFILPFLRDLGRPIAPFDFSLPGVTTMSADGHKLGLMPLPTGFFVVRDRELLTRAIPSEVTLIHTISSTKNGGTAAAAWAVLRRLGRRGYRRTMRRAMAVMDELADGIAAIPGLRVLQPPLITVLAFTSDRHDVAALADGLRARRWGSSHGVVHGTPMVRLSISPYRDLAHARGFVAALRGVVAELNG